MPERCQIRDPVHNFMELGEVEVKLVSTPLFQRLRGIRQLALANLVYPGALHTRFDHALGVFHIADLIARRLRLTDDESRLVRLAALLHDLGHGPFSHVSEGPLRCYANSKAIPPDQKKEKIHELITAHLIQNDPDIVKILGADTCRTIVKLLSRGHGRPALRSIVSGPLDADKQDYLLRDSQFCGVQYGLFDMHQLHRSFVLEGPRGQEELMVDADGTHALEQYVLAKYYLTTNVYRHKVRLITDQMIERAIVLGVEVDQLEDLKNLYRFDYRDEFFLNYSKWNDARLLANFSSEAKPGTYCGRILQRLQDRMLYKRVYKERIRDLGAPDVAATFLDIGEGAHRELRSRMERMIAEELANQFRAPIDPLEVVIHAFSIKSVRASSRNHEAGIQIVDRKGFMPFEEASTLIESIDESYTEGFVEVYAPVQWDTRAHRFQHAGAMPA